ncbi:hypothetical protein BJY04DRAFT_195955, partial [Aspergillus karnatakaensis]|uniref:uncharacterized protein n=1 Tax=Aspergillus karnatakaensis TaxID=1810916 RepID=UPI003CCD11CE
MITGVPPLVFCLWILLKAFVFGVARSVEVTATFQLSVVCPGAGLMVWEMFKRCRRLLKLFWSVGSGDH